MDENNVKIDLNEARRYALCIVFDTRCFEEFAVSMIDCMGEQIVSLCKDLYKELYQLAFSKGFHMDSEQDVDIYSDSDLMGTFYCYKERQKEKEEYREEDFKENIDELQFLIRQCRDREAFKKMLNFVGRFSYLAAYNAMLVEMQKPGAKFVFPGKEWRKYGRTIKPNAQQLITLKNFGPVQCMFDFSDTEPIPGREVVEEEELMEMWDNGLKNPNGVVDPELLKTLIENLLVYGIYLDDSFMAANTYGGYIMPYSHLIDVHVGKTTNVKTNSRFLISVNHKQTDAEKFHTICHELGHLFCYHQSYKPDKRRLISLKEREFEAETVAWLVSKRHGINNPSEEYLATYAPEGEIPICSTELIMKAVTEVERMIEGPVPVTKGLWYKEDKQFKEIIDKAVDKKKVTKAKDKRF